MNSLFRAIACKGISAIFSFLYVILICLPHSHALAQTDSVYWSFGSSGNASAAATSSSYAGVPASGCLADTGNVCCTFTSASGYTTLYFTTNFPSSTYPGASGEPTMRNNAKTGGFNASTSTYFSFTVTPTVSTTVEIKEIHFAGLKNATGPGSYTIRTSADGYASSVGTGTLSTSYGSSKKSHTGLSIQGTAGVPITVRIYTHNPVVTATGGNVFIDDVVIYYDAITVIPTTITTGSISSSSICAGAAIQVPYTVTGTYNSGNMFTAQLSDATGSFTAPINIGNVLSTTSGTINATIPAATMGGTAYSIRVVSNNPVVTGSDNGANITILPAVVPIIAVNVSPGTTICAGATATFTPVVTNGGSNPGYVWKKNNGTVATSPAYSANNLNNGDIITVELTSNATCALPATVTSSPVAMTVNAVLVPAVSIAESPAGAICSGTSVTFTATPVNGGVTPVYHWKKNSMTVGSNADTYIDNTLANGDIITVEMTSSETCVSPATVTSNVITMNVKPPVIPSASISAAPGNSICEGTSVTFSANVTNGGTSPLYKWKLNGTNVGPNANVYTTAGLTDGSIITVEVLGNADCAITTPVASNAIKMEVAPTTPPAALLTVQPANTIVPGQAVTFTLYIADGGNNPTIKWLKNGVELTGITGTVYNTNTLAHNDTIACFVQSSNTCATPDTTTSNAYVIRYIGTGITQTESAVNCLMLYPNPNNGTFTVKGTITKGYAAVTIHNVLGQQVYKNNIPVSANNFNHTVVLKNMPSGSYYLTVQTASGNEVLRFSLQ